MRKILAAGAAVLILAGCGSSVEPQAPQRPALTEKQKLTKEAIGITWETSSPAEREQVCNGFRLFTDEKSAELLGGGDQSLDWDYAVVILKKKCGVG